MTSLERAIDWLARSLHWIATGLLAMIMVTVFMQVVFRYVLGMAVPWTEEAARYFNVWMVFIGCAVAAAREGHIRVTYFLDRVKGPLKTLLLFAMFLVMGAFEIIVFFGAIKLVKLNWNQFATTLPVSIGVLYIALIVSSFATVLFLLRLVGGRLAGLFGGKA